MPDAGWREAAAAALEAQAAALDAALAELGNAEPVLERLGRDKLATELRGLAAGIRSEVAELQAEARELRRRPDVDGRTEGFPLALTAPATTRHPRGGRP
jgi:hypothetical protein